MSLTVALSLIAGALTLGFLAGCLVGMAWTVHIMDDDHEPSEPH